MTEANELSQRLVAILAADVAGYSRLMAEDNAQRWLRLMQRERSSAVR